MKCDMVMAVLIDKRTDVAPRVQEILTEYGCIIERITVDLFLFIDT